MEDSVVTGSVDQNDLVKGAAIHAGFNQALERRGGSRLVDKVALGEAAADHIGDAGIGGTAQCTGLFD